MTSPETPAPKAEGTPPSIPVKVMTDEPMQLSDWLNAALGWISAGQLDLAVGKIEEVAAELLAREAATLRPAVTDAEVDARRQGGAGVDAEHDPVLMETRELRRAVSFFDRVAVTSEAEKPAVGTDHWTWFEKAARSVVTAFDAIPEPPAGATRSEMTQAAREVLAERLQPAETLRVEFHQQDFIPGFAAFLPGATTPRPDSRAYCVLNLGSFLGAIHAGDANPAELPYAIAESMMHEVMHVLEQWAETEFSEERIEALLDKYRAAHVTSEPSPATSGEARTGGDHG